MRSIPPLLVAALLVSCSGSRNLDINRALDTERDDGGEQLDASDEAAGEDADALDDAPNEERDAALELDAGENGGGLDDGSADAGTAEDAGASADAAGAADAGPSSLALVGQPFVAGSSGSACGIAYDSQRDSIWVYACSGATLQQFSTAGAQLASLPRPGEAANDVDVDFAPAAFSLGGVAVATGDMLFIDGESGPAEIYLVPPELDAGAPRSLATQFGASHVVGGAYHIARGTFFAIQDRVPGSTLGNQVAEIDAATGAVLRSFSTLPDFDVNYGDLEVCQATGNLLLVSSNESTLGEFTPEGNFIAKHALPSGVSGLSGIGLDDATGTAWLSSTSRNVFQVSGLPCPRYAP